MTEATLCDGFADDYSAYLDGELEASRADEIAAHLETCALCNERIDALGYVDALLREAPAPAPPADLYARLQSRIAESEAASRDGSAGPARSTGSTGPRRPGSAPPGPLLQRRRRGRVLRTGFGIAVVAAAAALAVLLLPTTGPEPGTGEQPDGQVATTDGQAAPANLVTSFDGSSADDAVEIALALDLDTVEDFDMIANLELLERLIALEGEAS